MLDHIVLKIPWGGGDGGGGETEGKFGYGFVAKRPSNLHPI